MQYSASAESTLEIGPPLLPALYFRWKRGVPNIEFLMVLDNFERHRPALSTPGVVEELIELAHEFVNEFEEDAIVDGFFSECSELVGNEEAPFGTFWSARIVGLIRAGVVETG